MSETEERDARRARVLVRLAMGRAEAIAERNEAQIVASHAEACLTETLAEVARLKEKAGWSPRRARSLFIRVSELVEKGRAATEHETVDVTDDIAAIMELFGKTAPPTADPGSGGVRPKATDDIEIPAFLKRLAGEDRP